MCTIGSKADYFKAELLEERAKSYGVKISKVLTGNAARLYRTVGDARFDRIFIDAPCSGLGTLRRHQEIRWRVTPEGITDLSEKGLAMLRSASKHVEKGGDIIYSTCTVTHEENNSVIRRFLESEEGSSFKLVTIAGKACFASRVSPGSPDAHFAARLMKQK